jgi:hypothetical protein
MIRDFDFFSSAWDILPKRKLRVRDFLRMPGYNPPPATARGTPSGNPMTDGFPVKIACVNLPTISFEEISVMPFGLDGGDLIPQSTMFNKKWHTGAPRVLIKVTDGTGEAAWEPETLDVSQVQAQININQGWTFTFPNGDTWSAWAALQSFIPDTMEEGKRPTAKFKINPTNLNPTTGAEEGPVLVSAGGT